MLPSLTVRSVTKAYGATRAVESASFTLQPGTVTCLLGPSGCGKSTLLRLIAGLEQPDAGEIALGEDRLSAPGFRIPPEARGIGLVFQDYALFPHLDVVSNIGFGLKGLERPDRDARVAGLLEHFRLGHRARAFPHTLSGGEQQRVAIARALARQPAVVLMDEPFSGLDRHLRSDIRATVLSVVADAGAAVLVVTHDPQEAMLIGDHLVLMAGGRILQQGPAEDCYRAPVSLTAARLTGEVNALPVIVRNGTAETPFGRLAAPGLADGPAVAVIRPQGLRQSAEGGAARILSVRFLGPHHLVHLEAGGTSFEMWSATAPETRDGEVRIAMDPELVTVIPT